MRSPPAAVAAGAICVLAQHALDQASADRNSRRRGRRHPGLRIPRPPSQRLRAHGATALRAASSASPGPRARPPRKTSCATCSPPLAACAPRRATRTTSSAFPNTVLAARADTRNVIVEMGMRGLAPARGAVRVRAPAMGSCHQRRRKPYRASRQPTRTSLAPRPSSSRRCPQAAWRSSTPQTT